MTLLLTLHLIVTVAMIGVILLQKSDGGASMLGAGSSSSMFSARGVANLLTHTTSVLATLFLVLCIAMTWLSTHNASKKSAGLLDASPISQTEHAKEPTEKPAA